MGIGFEFIHIRHDNAFVSGQRASARTADIGIGPLDEALMSDPPRPKTVVLLRTMLGQDPNAPIPQFAPEAGQ